MSVSESAWEAAVAAIERSAEPVLACHLGPDGDALGSMVALGIALRNAGRSVVASWGSEPFSVPSQYDFLPGLDLLRPPERVPAAPATMVTFDAGSFDRLGSIEPNARAAQELVVVDHHRSNDRFGSINLIDPDAAASAVLTLELIRRMGLKIDRDVATCLYVGLVTDTGRFQYRNTTPGVMEVAADLLSHGIEHDAIARRIYDTHPFGYLKVLGVALGRAALVRNGRHSIVWTYLTQQDLAGAGIDMDDTEALIDVVRTAAEAEVACVMKQTPDGNYKVSMRAKQQADVGKVCEALGGGGHALAAGFTSPSKDPQAIIAQIAGTL